MVLCPECGEENSADSKYCSDCGNFIENVENVQNGKDIDKKLEYTPRTAEYIGAISLLLGIIVTEIFFLISLGAGIYLYRLKEEQPKRHGKFLILASIGIWIVFVIIKAIF